jgi:branched-chain amino acid transport system ATP-binding protein
MLRVNNLSKRFGGLAAVGEVSFDVAMGEIVALIGPN